MFTISSYRNILLYSFYNNEYKYKSGHFTKQFYIPQLRKLLGKIESYSLDFEN